jgi:ABC-type transporter Mla subunit MlaD
MNRIQRDTLLGLVFFGTMAFLLWATVNLTDISLGRVPPLQVWFRDTGGIREGDPVLVLGKRIGKVKEIEFLRSRPDNRMRVTMLIEEELPLSVQQKIEIQDSNALGGRQVYIDPGIGEPWPPDRELVGTTSGNPLLAAGRFFEGEGPSGSELRSALAEIRSFFQGLNDPDTTVGALTRRRELYDEVLASVQSLRRIFQSVEDGDGLFGRVINDTNLRDDGLRIVANLARVTERLNGTESTLGRLLNDNEMSNQLATIVTNLNAVVARLNDGRGLAGALLRDDQMAADFQTAIAALSRVLQKADDPDAGALGTILGDRELKDDLKLIATNLRSITDKIDSGKGVLGVLINDEDLGIRLRRIFNQISRALEDARESAPIGNFVQVLLGTF